MYKYNKDTSMLQYKFSFKKLIVTIKISLLVDIFTAFKKFLKCRE